MAGNKLALRLLHSLVDRPKTNAFARVTSNRSPGYPFPPHIRGQSLRNMR